VFSREGAGAEEAKNFWGEATQTGKSGGGEEVRKVFFEI